MQSVNSNFTSQSGANSNIHYPLYGVQISFTKAQNPSYNFFTIGTSIVGGSDFLPGGGKFPAFFDQFQFTDYSDYATQVSITRNIGQYPYGAIGANASVTLDNTSLLFLPGYDPVIGQYITYGRPMKLQVGYGSSTINVFAGTSTQPQNNILDRTITMSAFDGMDTLNNFYSTGSGPLAALNNGNYINVPADQIIGDLLTEVGLGNTEYILENSLQPNIGYYCPNGLLIGDIIRAFCEAEQAIFLFDENGIAHFWNRQHIYNNQASVWTFNETDSLFNLEQEETPVINDVQFTGQPRFVDVDQLLYTQGSAVEIPAPVSTAVLHNVCPNPNFNVALTNWTSSGGTLSRDTTTFYDGNGAAKLISTGTSQYAFVDMTITASTSYVAQARILGTAGKTVRMQAISNGVTLATIDYTLDANWDLVALSNIPAGVGDTTLELRIMPTSSTTIWIDNVLVTESGNAVGGYFDGNSAATTSYMFAWDGTANLSTTTATPVGFLTVQVSASDNDGQLPIVSIDALQYYTVGGATSVYRTNTAADNSGTDMQSNTFVQSTVLMTQPSSATSLSGSTVDITFLNSNTVPIFLTELVVWGKPAKLRENINTEYQNQASMAVYGTNPANNGQPLQISNDLVQSSDTAHSNAFTLVQDFSTPYQRAIADVAPVPQLQIGDTITIASTDTATSVSTPLGLLVALTHTQTSSGFTEYTIVGKTLEFSPSNLISQKLELEVRISVKYFTINVSAIGGSDQIAP